MLRPITSYRDDLIEDPRFWGHGYWQYLEARADDDFADGLFHFLGVSSEAANEWLDELALPVREGYFPEVAVTVPLKNGWRAGIVLSCYPEDFAIQQVIVSPEGTLTAISVSGGATESPGLRWEELLPSRIASYRKRQLPRIPLCFSYTCPSGSRRKISPTTSGTGFGNAGNRVGWGFGTLTTSSTGKPSEVSRAVGNGPKGTDGRMMAKAAPAILGRFATRRF